MGFGDMIWPFGFAFTGAMLVIAFILAVIVIAFCIWMFVDCAKRSFRNHAEKIAWIVAFIVGLLFGFVFLVAIVYLILIKNLNPRGLAKK